MKRFTLIILFAGFLVGTLDILAAFLQYYINFHRNPLRVLLFIASGVFGKSAYTGGSVMYVAGALFHYIIAYVFTILFFFCYPLISKLSTNRIITGIVYGVFVWTVMNLLVVPLSRTPSLPFQWPKAFLAMGILVVAIGIPLSFLAYHYYSSSKEINKVYVPVV